MGQGVLLILRVCLRDINCRGGEETDLKVAQILHMYLASSTDRANVKLGKLAPSHTTTTPSLMCLASTLPRYEEHLQRETSLRFKQYPDNFIRAIASSAQSALWHISSLMDEESTDLTGP
jgi:hypothetical protein